MRPRSCWRRMRCGRLLHPCRAAPANRRMKLAHHATLTWAAALRGYTRNSTVIRALRERRPRLSASGLTRSTPPASLAGARSEDPERWHDRLRFVVSCMDGSVDMHPSCLSWSDRRMGRQARGLRSTIIYHAGALTSSLDVPAARLAALFASTDPRTSHNHNT